jgi:hypothetical protein
MMPLVIFRPSEAVRSAAASRICELLHPRHLLAELAEYGGAGLRLDVRQVLFNGNTTLVYPPVGEVFLIGYGFLDHILQFH